MAAGDLAVVARFVVEVLEQGDLAALEELVDTKSAAIDWAELKALLATIEEEAPGLRYHVSDLEEQPGLVAGKLHLSVPIAFHVSSGRIDDITLPEYFLPAPQTAQPAASDDQPEEPLPGIGLETRLRLLRDAIDDAAAELAGTIERYERITRDLAEARERQAEWEERAARAREEGRGAGEAQARAEAQQKLVKAYQEQQTEIGKLIQRLAAYLRASEELLLRFERRAEELAAQQRLAGVVESLDVATDTATGVAERIAGMEAQMSTAEAAAAEATTRARQTYERRLAALRARQERGPSDLDERLQQIAAEIESAQG